MSVERHFSLGEEISGREDSSINPHPSPLP